MLLMTLCLVSIIDLSVWQSLPLFLLDLGNNLGCSSNGFPATTGWNPISLIPLDDIDYADHILKVMGFGLPNFVALRALAGL